MIAVVHARFSAANRERISRAEIAEAVAFLDFAEYRSPSPAPRLTINALHFTGTKHLHDSVEASPICYDQVFQSGVNVLLIPDNDVGKSSILKTIRFGLTGDDDDYDRDVRGWLLSIRLTFTVGGRIYTNIISLAGDLIRAVLMPGTEQRAFDDLSDAPDSVFRAVGSEHLKTQLKNFFLSELGLARLSWTQGTAEVGTSWLTYFQALSIPDSGDDYLICDAAHAMGNQEGLILSTFLGLRLVEPLNRLGVEVAQAGKAAKLPEEEIRKMMAETADLEAELVVCRAKIAAFDAELRRRREEVERGEPAGHLLAIRAAILEQGAERQALDTERAMLSTGISRDRAQARILREAISLDLHFTGIDVRVCPNCDARVDEEALRQEQAGHNCRLCGKHAAPGTSTAGAMELQAADVAYRAERDVQHRTRLISQIIHVDAELARLQEEEKCLHQAMNQGASYAFPALEEVAERDSLVEQAGALQARITIARSRAEQQETDKETLGNRKRILEKVREIVREIAQQRNQDTLQRLQELTLELVRRIGAESINGITCSPLGRLDLSKNSISVPFGQVNNQGERIRIKLAFFLAMMRLGREPGLGKHPGFLLIDQLGSAEMVSEDCASLAGALRTIDRDLGETMQIICFTARLEFATATAADKIYGAQIGKFAF